VAVAALVVLIAFVDQGGKDTPPYDANHASYVSDSAFFAGVHARLSDGAAVFNLPYQPFPEAPPRGQIGEFDEAVGYIFQPTLKWSFGSMRGRVPDYPKVLETQPTEDWMTSIAAIGFTGIVVDRAGYTEAERATLESQIAALAGPPVVSADGRYSFYDLRAFATDVRARLGDAGTKARADEALALRSPPASP
jgi:phosphoglycerol transferase